MSQARVAPSESDLAIAAWRVSSYSGGQGDCVEIADNLPHLVPVRDSKFSDSPVIGFSHDAWQAFVSRLP
ncbi:DUF397 domain-containing protein [Streptomyces sp. NBC_00268]|uniref:DUF397 domain-containing protein n=1 Tax=Streptomyces sp. NBC_00268 TaxID=2975695 RepID=UPI002251D148|nr:DUF397 domain-containing protein [Streptomyces sp. NBC_00268]MCX5184245.1 DUF397 domain-containing protein [Streptomyces sp. NBC_00268]